jgi:hypothetical protein
MDDNSLDDNTLSILKDSCDEDKITEKWRKEFTEYAYSEKLPSDAQADLMVWNTFNEAESLEDQLTRQRLFNSWLLNKMVHEIALTRKMIIILTNNIEQVNPKKDI